jgi:uncharacterized phiE125 gp8 family phage protein
MGLRVITLPAVEPLTLEQAQEYLKTDENVTALIKAAREYCENYQNKKYMPQTLELILDRFPCKPEIEFSDCSPIQSVTSVKYYGTDNMEYTFDASNYIVDIDSFVARIVLAYGKTWPSIQLRPANGVVIRFEAGYDTVPETVKQAMVLHMKTLYDNQSPEVKARWEKARDALLGMRRRIPV